MFLIFCGICGPECRFARIPCTVIVYENVDLRSMAADHLLASSKPLQGTKLAVSCQVSTKANNSSNLPRRWIDSRRNRRYSLPQIPDLGAYTNPRFNRTTCNPGLRSFRGARSQSSRSFFSRFVTPEPTPYTISRCSVAAPHCAVTICLLLTPSCAPSRAPRSRDCRTVKINRAGGRQIH
jgi:hypothetical protein